jgi:hypothetical protein
VRRIACYFKSLKRMAITARDQVRSYTTTRHVETRATVDALAGVKQKSAADQLKSGEAAPPGQGAAKPPPLSRPDPKMKFEAKGKPSVEGDITSVVGGATDKPIPAEPKKIEPKGMPTAGGHLGGLMAAKKRAQQQIKEKEQGES